MCRKFRNLSAEMHGWPPERNRRIDIYMPRVARLYPLKWHRCSGWLPYVRRLPILAQVQRM